MGASSDEPTDQHSGSAASSEANYRSDLLANRTSHPEFPFCLSVSADYTPNGLSLCLGFSRPEPSEGTEGARLASSEYENSRKHLIASDF